MLHIVLRSALEPFFNAAASQFILGQQIPVTLWLSLAPVVLGVYLFLYLLFTGLVTRSETKKKKVFQGSFISL